MLQETVQQMAMEISQLKRYTDQQQNTVNELVDKVNEDPSINSRSNWSIPWMIETNGTPSTDSSKLSMAQALIASLQPSLAEAKKNWYRPKNKGPGRGGDQAGSGGRGDRGGDRRHLGVLGDIQEDVDWRLTW